MDIAGIGIAGALKLLFFFIGLLFIPVLYNLYRRTQEDIKLNFLLMLIAGVLFAGFGFVSSMTFLRVFSVPLLEEAFLAAFVIVLFVSLWRMQLFVQHIADSGQSLVLVSENDHEQKLASLSGNGEKVCVVSTKWPSKELYAKLASFHVNAKNVVVLDASSVSCQGDGICKSVGNSPDDLKSALDRMLKEKSFSRVIVDDISSISGVRDFEMPLVVQQLSEVIKANDAQGLFIGERERLDEKIISDIAMIVDNTKRE